MNERKRAMNYFEQLCVCVCKAQEDKQTFGSTGENFAKKFGMKEKIHT